MVRQYICTAGFQKVILRGDGGSSFQDDDFNSTVNNMDFKLRVICTTKFGL
jgi:hypothetical protein